MPKYFLPHLFTSIHRSSYLSLILSPPTTTRKNKSAKMPLPPIPAAPSQVREYIAEILISKHDVDPSGANEVANLWTLGRSSDLRQADS